MEILFRLAVLFIPFDNLKFAPSAGWATISPILFALYAISNFKELKQSIRATKNYAFLIIVMVIYSTGLYLFYEPDIANTFDTITTLSFGIFLYLSLYIRYIIYKNDMKKDLKILIFAYTISFFYGVVKFVAIKGNVGFILSAFQLVERRYYPRLAFTFTEPSFISIHVAGVMYLLYVSIKDKLYKKKLLQLVCLFCALTIISGDSARFLVDFIIVFSLVVMKFLVGRKVKLSKKIMICTLIVIMSGALLFQIKGNTRVTKMLNGDSYEEMIYSDPSLSARYFRINSSIHGYLNEPYKALFGAGLGNSYYFLQYGYDDALAEFKNSYIDEVAGLADQKTNQLFCMPIRIISEMGVVWFSIIMFLIFFKTIKNKENIFDLLIIIYLYVQFDSYAYYTFPLYLFIIDYRAYRRRKERKELKEQSQLEEMNMKKVICEKSNGGPNEDNAVD
ncbi:hypothetical protein LGK95_10520 [Clostridium algoriphilum]|uniref:hypothetical protein n=1 Tax=Clostridium algoriphilum TaxID=198347 RepID=UPI001CF25D7C|nr:hypothetical protein [Clostridium algoriphilum]MCB2293952.1 hypothetical protein [Clostridium algoriphilum]